MGIFSRRMLSVLGVEAGVRQFDHHATGTKELFFKRPDLTAESMPC